MDKSNWLCLDCGKDTLRTDDYYMLRNKLWRELVPREQRHGMLCLACVSKRLDRPLRPEDFYNGSNNIDYSDPEERPMDLADYGIVDALTPTVLAAIDRDLVADIAPSLPRNVGGLIRTFVERSTAAVPGLPDYFYLLRIEQMINAGVLAISSEADDLMHCEVRLADLAKE